MKAVDLALLRARSRVAFGQQYRLECMLTIGDSLGDATSLTELADRLQLGASSIQSAFKALVDVGLLTPVPSDEYRRRRYLPDASSAAWQWASQLADGV